MPLLAVKQYVILKYIQISSIYLNTLEKNGRLKDPTKLYIAMAILLPSYVQGSNKEYSKWTRAESCWRHGSSLLHD
jgi:hypothetical protein